ncbi:MAG TPA: tetratricopeptide repeat protein [Patescibacteria group bacterium]|nr:tetratricopeptide repeat protein [Patescibacteria group bacterium]
MTPLKTQAIQIALTGNWEEAITLNQDILKEEPQDIDTLNRLAFAYTAMGKLKEARETYQKVLDIDNANPIAQKNLKKLGGASASSIRVPSKISTNMFLEESGKTKIVTLVNTAPAQVIRTLQVGQTVFLCVKRLKVFVQDETKSFIGMLPDDLGLRLIKFIEGGNTYEAYVKAASGHDVVIFLKEAIRTPKFKNQPTFLFGDKTHLSFSKKNYASSREENSSEGE